MRPSGNWFTNSFLACGGVGTAALLVAVGVFASFYFAADKHLSQQLREAERQAQARAALTAEALKIAKPRLEQYGIVEVSDETGAIEDAGDVVLVGTGRAAKGGLKEFALRYRVATFGKERRWSLQRLVIDGKEHFTTE